MIRAVLFDAVGTLFGVRGSVGAIYSEQARAFGVEFSPAELDSRFRAVFATKRPPTTDARTWWQAVVAETFTGVTFPEFDAYFQQIYQHFASAQPWQLYPETVEVLLKLQERGLLLAIVSNFDERLYPVLEAFEIRPYFQAVALSSEVGFAKPDPRLFAVALEQLGCSAGQALHVGDSPEDVIGAGAAGVRALKIDRTAKADGTIDTLLRVLATLD